MRVEPQEGEKNCWSSEVRKRKMKDSKGLKETMKRGWEYDLCGKKTVSKTERRKLRKK